MCGGSTVNHPNAGWWKSSTPTRKTGADGWGRQTSTQGSEDKSSSSMEKWGRQISERSVPSPRQASVKSKVAAIEDKTDGWGKKTSPKAPAKEGAKEEKKDSFKKEAKKGEKTEDKKDSVKKQAIEEKPDSPKKHVKQQVKSLEEKQTRCPSCHPLIMMTIGKVPADCPSDVKYTGSKAHSCDVCGKSPIRKGVVFRCAQCNYDVGPCCGREVIEKQSTAVRDVNNSQITTTTTKMVAASA